MATTTTNLGLTQPDEAEGYDVAVFNANADIIDNAVGTLQSDLSGAGSKVDAVKTDTEEIKSTIGTTADAEGGDTIFGQLKSLQTALNTANQNIATLLTQTKGVKAIVNGNVTLSVASNATVTIPDTMNPDRTIFLMNNIVNWDKEGNVITIQSNINGVAKYQIIEFY